MAGRSELDELRAEARRLRANATAKAGRLRRQGVVVQGSGFDPRRAPGVEKSYNRAQLRSYVNQMNAFNARSTKFVAGAEGRPVAFATANRLKSLARISNVKAMNRLNAVKDVRMPGTDMTFGESRVIAKSRRSPVPSMTYDLIHVDPKQIMGESAAKKLARTIEKRTNSRSRNSMNKNAYTNIHNMLNESGNQFLKARFDSLTTGQRELLMNTPSFWESVKFSAYRVEGIEDDGEHESDVMSLINWAESARPAK